MLTSITGIGLVLDAVKSIEPELSLGIGSLNRLAACFQDSIAALDLPGDGVGLNGHYDLFRQKFDRGKLAHLPVVVSFGGFDLKAALYDIAHNLTSFLRRFCPRQPLCGRFQRQAGQRRRQDEPLASASAIYSIWTAKNWSSDLQNRVWKRLCFPGGPRSRGCHLHSQKAQERGLRQKL